MKSSDLVALLTALSSPERKRLMVFMETAEPGMEVRSEEIRLAGYLLEHLEEPEDSPLFSKTSVYTYVFPNKPVIPNKLEKTMSTTLHWVRAFIAHETAGKQMTALQEAYYLQKFYNERNLEKKYQQSRKQLEKLKSVQQAWTPKDYYFQFLSELEEAAFQSVRNDKKDDLNIWKTIQTLDEYYLLERLRYTCILLNQNQLAPLALPPLTDWLPFDQNTPAFRWFFEKPLGQLFGSALELLKKVQEQNSQKFGDFVDLLIRHESQIGFEYLSIFEVFACNYGIRWLNKGHFEFTAPVFQLQQRRVESGRIYFNGVIRAAELQVIVTIGLRLGEKDWVRQFLENNRHKIQGSMDSGTYYQFNLAHYQYYIGEYEPALKTLLTSSYDEMHYKFYSKLLEIKILWEMSRRNQSDERVAEFLENKIEAAIIYFFREKKLADDKRKMGKRFADIMKRIVHADGKRDVDRLKMIQQDIAKADLIAERQWLSKVTEELISRYK